MDFFPSEQPATDRLSTLLECLVPQGAALLPETADHHDS